MSLAAVNHIYVFREALNVCKKSKHSLRACFKNVKYNALFMDVLLVNCVMKGQFYKGIIGK